MDRICRASSPFYLIFLVIALIAGCGKDSSQAKGSSIGLSAYFVDVLGHPIDDPNSNVYAQSHLHVAGEAYKDGSPVGKGAVNITVVADDLKFNQSVFVPLDETGKFSAPEDAFHAVRPGTPITITAYITAPGLNDVAILKLNSERPVTKLVTEIGISAVVLTLLGVFLFSFTGRRSMNKNRTAIQFSYLVIILFLAVPIVAPVMVFRLFPNADDAMIGYPAGLVVTCFGEPPHEYPQWALNIGGYSHVDGNGCPNQDSTNEKTAQSARNSDTTTTAQTSPNTGSTMTNGKQKEQPVSRSSPIVNGARGPASAIKRETSDSSRTTSRHKVPIPSESAPSKEATQDGSAAVSGSPAPPSGERKTVDVPSPENDNRVAEPATDTTPKDAQDLTDSVLHPERLYPGIARVRGGLVIPLYVIILSVIGGAINMTRKVPGFQKEGEDSLAQARSKRENQQSSGINGVGQSLDTSKDAPPPAQVGSQSLEEQAAQVDAELDLLIPAQVKRNTDTTAQVPRIQLLVQKMQDFFAANTNTKLCGFETFDEWYLSRPKLREVLGSNWRVELLNQYMYLVSAPFLAIVTYYILDLLGLSKPGVVVVMSFSVGLISEKIVTWILGIATGYMQTPKKA